MLIRADVLERIRAGEVTLAFRRWRRPTVRPGGTLRTAIGVLAIDSVEPIPLRRITAKDARLAGYKTLAELTSSLTGRDGDVYKVSLRFAGDDPRVSLRESLPSPEEIALIRAKLRRMDERSNHGPWTFTVLALIAERPGVRAPDLAASLGRDTLRFKADVRRLKELGLTESLEVGYRLSPRGRAVVEEQPTS
ncbi:ASCH domain-containing protein [Kibdelosporangium persicum]|uniref:HTH marR-type domain-containing protein n=1 Tax=Kibdelosporangium persicum TaxID=2698649 RepID=A0ABX2F336_9PSEU|nr:ASCH domain-containing protein [Kibdelosporangium persicum]NRN65613.1 HTH marR-type domain-containing protein [Kibdelosporangium persicum]